MTIKISVVVPTDKQPDLLDRCLLALLEQDYEPSAYEVIVVDDADSPETRRQAEDWAARFQGERGVALFYVPVRGPHGPAIARNRGWQAARGEIIAFTEDDCIPLPGWLRTGARSFTNGVTGVRGKLFMPLPSKQADAARLVEGDFVTANCFVRKNALEAVGGFDERFSAAWREDSDLYFSLLRQKRYFVQAPDAVVLHPARPARWGESLKEQKKSRFEALLYKKHRDLYRTQIRPPRPLHYYAIVGALAACAAAALTGRKKTASAAAGVWLAFTGRFFARRMRGTERNPSRVAEMAVTSILIPPLSIFWRIYGAVKYKVWFY